MKIDVVIPHIGNQELLNKTLSLYKENCNPEITSVIVIDNGSAEPLVNEIYGRVVRFNENLGMIDGLEQAKILSDAPILMYTHSDMLYYEKGWDQRVIDAFKANEKLGLVGIVGATEAHLGGGRGEVHLSFRNWQPHGYLTPREGVTQVALLDGCCMIFRRSALDSFEIDKGFMPHHFYDKDWSLEVLSHGWNVGAINIDCEHLSGQVANFTDYQDWANEYLRKRGIDNKGLTGDMYFYYANEARYNQKWADSGILPVFVSTDGTLTMPNKAENLATKIQHIVSAWKGHEIFAINLVRKFKPETVVDLGVDYGFSTFAFAFPNIGRVYGIDWFAGDQHAGHRNTHEAVLDEVQKLGLKNVEIIKGDFYEVSKTWKKPIDILHIDGAHDYADVKKNFNDWILHVKDGGIILMHDTCSFADSVGVFFKELDLPKYNFTHSHGLGVVAFEQATLDKALEGVLK